LTSKTNVFFPKLDENSCHPEIDAGPRSDKIHPRYLFSHLEARLNTTLRLGEHYICDLSGCAEEIMLDSERAYALFSHAVRQSGLTIVDEGFYKFSPHGFTCFLLLAESHASLHAWPEYGYCAIDLFTCNLGMDMIPLVENIKTTFGAQSYSLRRLDREAALHTAPRPVIHEFSL
jgi:S-adenosylmethionine decarboxylase